MSRNMARILSVCGSFVVAAAAPAAASPFYGGTPQPQCICAQPVMQTHYQTVPVTEYRQVRQTVQRPVYETKYVDQDVVTYSPVVEQRTVEVPTVDYQDVVEHRTAIRDMGQWQTRYEHRYIPSPCEYDPRPGLVGWLNRTGFQIRTAFTPRVVAHRDYVPNVVAMDVPVTRRIARAATRQVTYNVTRMVPQKTTRKVAVNTVRYVAEEVTNLQPVTVMRSVPIGSSIAYAYTPLAGAPQTALAPTPDPLGRAQQPSNKRTANAADGKGQDAEQPIPERKIEGTRYEPGTPDEFETKRLSHPAPAAERTAETASSAQGERPRSVPSIVQAGRWISRRHAGSSAEGPSLPGPSLSVAHNNR